MEILNEVVTIIARLCLILVLQPFVALIKVHTRLLTSDSSQTCAIAHIADTFVLCSKASTSFKKKFASVSLNLTVKRIRRGRTKRRAIPGHQEVRNFAAQISSTWMSTQLLGSDLATMQRRNVSRELC